MTRFIGFYREKRSILMLTCLVGEPDRDEAGNVTWEASIEDEEGALDAITLTLNQLPGESVESVADQLARVAMRMGAETRPTGR